MLQKLKTFFSPQQQSNRYVEQPPSLWLILTLLLPFLLIVILFTLMPLIFTVVLALREKTGFFQSEYRFSFNNFVKIFRDTNFQIGLGNTLLYTLFSVPLTLFFSLTISLLIASTLNRWVRSFWQTVFFLPYVTNSVAISLAFVYLFYPNGIIN